MDEYNSIRVNLVVPFWKLVDFRGIFSDLIRLLHLFQYFQNFTVGGSRT